MELQSVRTLSTVFVFILFLILERAHPFFKGRKSLNTHDVKNVIISLLNMLIVIVVFSWVLGRAGSFTFGLFNLLDLPSLLEMVLIVLVFDLWMYAWHVWNHTSSFLWRFHRMHHTDTLVDASSAFRFHPGEIVMSTALRIVIMTVLGLQLWHILVYELLLLPVIMFHHSNINIGARFDQLLRLVFASPFMHKIHHSDIRNETDSNYGSVFSFWDRLFRSYTMRSDPENIAQGLKDMKTTKWTDIIGMVKTPLQT